MIPEANSIQLCLINTSRVPQSITQYYVKVLPSTVLLKIYTNTVRKLQHPVRIHNILVRIRMVIAHIKSVYVVYHMFQKFELTSFLVCVYTPQHKGTP